MRVATVIVPFSLGLEQKENVRAFPSASVSDGLSRIKSAFCPGLKVKSLPPESNQNAMVPSATSRRSFKGNRCSTIGVLPDDLNRSAYLLNDTLSAVNWMPGRGSVARERRHNLTRP